MPNKTAPIGICDHCGRPFPANLSHYTRRKTPRLFCSIDCRNTANSRAGAEIIGRKTKERIERGEWINPATLNPPDPANIGAGVSRARKAEVEAGTWRNPALTDEARRKLSRPRKHGDNPLLHRALEQLKQGRRVADLTDAEAEAHRAYRRELLAARREEANAYARRYYRKRRAAMSEAEWEAQLGKWRAARLRRRGRKTG